MDAMEHVDGPVFNVVKAELEQTPALIALWGFSDSGKTYSALRLARGLVGPKGKIVVIDTENKRAKFYASMFGGWHHIDMQPPFTPQRYTGAFDAAIQAGADVIVVDSMSHVWEGEGGVLEQADASNAKGLLKWKVPKMAYARMVNRLLRAPVPVIFCLREKDKMVQKGDKVEHVGQEPICGKRFIFEMTVACHMESGKRTPINPVKAPDPVKDVIQPGEYITEAAGAAITAWLAGGATVNHAAQAAQAEARIEAQKGSVAFRDWWQTRTKDQNAPLRKILAELQQIAADADVEAAKAEAQIDAANSGGDPLDDPFTGKAA
jgi:hypothetical protein